MIPHERAITLKFSDTNSGWWATPLLFEIWAQTDQPPMRHADFDRFPLITSQPRDSEKSSIMTNRTSTTGFPARYRWSAYVTLSPQRVAQKVTLFFSIKFNFDRIKSATKFLCVKTSSGKVVV